MKESKSTSNKQPNRGRRSFIWKAGAAVSAVLAAAVPAVSMQKTGKDKSLKREVDRLTGRLGSLEDENRILELHRTFERYLDQGSYESLVDLFAGDGEVRFNGGVFKGKERGVRRLFCKKFSSGMTGKKMNPAPGFALNDELQEVKVEISQDGKTARARFPYSIQVGTPIISDSVLAKMARLQGNGIIKWWEGGIYNVSYVKDVKDGSWKIKRLVCDTLSKADYRPGRLYAKAIDIPAFSKVYPGDHAGPDRLFLKGRENRKA